MKTSSLIIIAVASCTFAAPICKLIISNNHSPVPSEQKNSNVQASNSPDTSSNWGAWKFPVLPSAPFKRSTPISDPSQNAPAFNDPLEETIPVPKPDVLLPPTINQIPDPVRPAGLPSLIARPPLKFDFPPAAPIGPGGEFAAPTEPVVPAQKRDVELPPPLNQVPDSVDPAKIFGPVTAPPL
ncbi:hypothetical protein BZA77DRAFT_347199 [Pyronema omphalodes]|nr:hypothetical protein BZA77DRAFT_347199 [Pyronema omphalodes]